MIIWLASYPKSGNTLLRSILSTYFYSQDGVLQFENLNKISQFPQTHHFLPLGIDIGNDKEVFKNFINAQNLINEEKGKLKFFKTHSCMATYKERPFTTAETTLGAIYIVRDPRNVLTSMKNHFSMNEEEAMEMIKDKQRGLISDDGIFSTYTLISSWANHYNSWAKTNHFRRLIIKYER